MMDSPSTPKPPLRDRLNALLAEWGPLLAIVYFSIFGLVLVGFALAIKAGFGIDSTAGTVGTWGAAWVATKLTQPLRIAATLVITPALGALIKRVRHGRSPAPAPEPEAAPNAPAAPSAAPLDEAGSLSTGARGGSVTTDSGR
jgi:hypothetical protein